MLGPLLLLAGMAAASWSVPIYDLRIVLTYTALAALLGWALARRAAWPVAGTVGWAVVLAVAGVVTGTVPTFTHISGRPSPAPAVLAATALAAALVLLLPAATRRPATPRAADAALAVAVLGFVVAAVALVRLSPAPRIDVWFMLQQAADGLAAGRDMYTQTWVGSPGVKDAFTYLPWTAVLLAPGRWLAGDVRWALVALPVAAALAVRALPGRQAPAPRRVAASAAAALLLVLPGTPTQVEQAWTEPLLLAVVVGAVLAIVHERPWAAVALLALGIASKQHLVLLLPLLAAWPRFGVRRAAVSAAIAGVLVLPWFVADPGAMWHDTVTLLVNFHAIRFSDTLYLAARTELGVTPPFWLTGAVVVGTLAAASLAVRRRNATPAAFLRWAALVLLVASLVNKQAFYNQYWLVAALLVAAWAAPDDGSAEAAEATDEDEDEGQRRVDASRRR